MGRLNKLLISHIVVFTFLVSSALSVLHVIPLHAAQPSAIKIVMDDNYPPYVFRDNTGALKGIIIDQWKLWEQKTGVRAEVTGMDWGEAQRRMQAGEFNVIDTIFRNEKREKIYDFTKPYARLDVPLFFNDDISGIHGPSDVKGFLVAAKEGDAAIDFLQRQGVTSIQTYPSYEKLIQAAKEGKVKVFTVDKPPAHYFLNKFEIQDHFRETAPMYSGEFHRAVLKRNEPVLKLVESGFAAISANEYRDIDERWMGKPILSGIPTKTVAIAIAVAGGVLAILVLWNFSLKVVIRRRTKELAESKRHFQSIYDSVNDAIFIHDLETGAIIDVNMRMCEMYGMTRDEALRASIEDLSSGVPPYTQADAIEKLNKAISGETQLFEWHARHKDGHLFWVEVNIRRTALNTDKTILVTVRDITERKQSEERLRKVSQVQARLHDPVSLDQKLKIITDAVVEIFNADFARIWLIRKGDMCETGCMHSEAKEGPHVCRNRDQCLHLVASSGRYTHLDGKAHCRVPYDCYKIGRVASGREPSFLTNDAANDPRVHNHEWAKDLGLISFAGYQLRPLHGETIGVMALFSKHTISSGEDALLKTIGNLIVPAIQSAQAEQALRESEANLNQAQAVAHIGSWHLDINQDILNWSDETYRIFGVPIGASLTYEAFLSLVHSDDRKAVDTAWKAALRGQPYDIEHRIVVGDMVKWIRERAVLKFDTQGQPLGAIGTALEITENKHLEEQLLQSQKMEAIGQLAGGIAHDFNNILTVIEGYCSLLQNDSLKEDQKKKIAVIIASAEKAAQLTNGLLAFSRKQPLIMKQENLNDIVQHVHKLVARIIGEDIAFRSDCCGTELSVNADKGQIEQVLINFATNARDAMPNGGEFTIKSDLVILDSTFAVVHNYEVPPGSYAMLTVSDTGTGIKKEHLEHIFEPFFTTKEVGKGTGLGMAIIYGIIKQHNGFINVYSEVGQGTTFRIYLPIQEQQEKPVAEKNEIVQPTRGNETLLVAEDEPSVRNLLSEILTGSGYEVILAENGIDAVEKFKMHQKRISLILMDMIMPQKNGKEAYEEIQGIRPGVRVLFFSGYTDDFIENRGISGSEIELIMKPVHPKELLRNVREMLDT